MCAKLHTVAASNNRNHASQPLLLLLVQVTHIYFYSSRTSRSWWITQSTQHHRRGCNNIPSFLRRTTPIARSLLCVKAELGTTSTSWSQHHFVAIGNPSGMRAKLHTVAASNNRDHASQSLLLLLVQATHIYFCSSRTSRSWWITQSTQHHRRGCNNSDSTGINRTKLSSSFNNRPRRFKSPSNIFTACRT